MRAKLRGWLKLPLGERWRLTGLLLGLPLVSLLLTVLGYRRTRRAMEQASPQAGQRVPSASELERAERLAQLASLAGNYGAVKATCLRQSLLTYMLLRRRGFDPELCLGARRQDGTFDAHAWVELGGRALGQANPQHQPFRPRVA